MKIIVCPPGNLTWKGANLRCAIGRGGIVTDKKEGDGGTPVGVLPLRRVFYRPDRLDRPETGLAVQALEPDDGWCDDPTDTAYNRLIKTPFAAGHEKLWRHDNIYDIIVSLGYNDDPVVAEKGSAIFLHVAKENYGSTAGCVALAEGDLLELLEECGKETVIEILKSPPELYSSAL